MKILKLTTTVCMATLLAACSEEPPPRSVNEFVENPMFLEATMVRCAQDRSKTKYEAECVNAREAANRLAAIEEESRSKELEAQFERKRRSLRRTQEAAAEARRRTADQQRRREEAEYLGVFETVPGEDGTAGSPDGEAVLEGNEPGVSVAPPEREPESRPANQPSEEPVDIDDIREELKRRQESSG